MTDLERKVSAQEHQLATVQQSIAQLTKAPLIRAQTLQEMEQRLPAMQQAHALVEEQVDLYKGSELEGTFTRERVESEKKLKQFQSEIEKTRAAHIEKDTADKKERRKLQHVEQELLRDIKDLKAELRVLEQKQAEERAVQGEQTYFEAMLRYRNLNDTIADKVQAQEQIFEQLAQWPDLQERFLQETSAPDPADGPARIAQAAIAYLEALIAESASLQGVTVHDGTLLSEVLALTDQEVLAFSHQGGLDVLRKKRALLTQFVG